MMVKGFESEHSNLSFVHINQTASAGANDFERAYITNGMQRTDPMVVNAELLDKSLTAPAMPEPIVATPHWDLNVGASESVAPVSAKLKETISRVPRRLSLVGIANNGQTDHTTDVSSAAATGAGCPTRGGDIGSSASAGAAVRREAAVADHPAAARALSPAPSASVPVGSQQGDCHKTARMIGAVPVIETHHAKLLQQNVRLVVDNTNLREKNLELQEKLNLLGSILRDPRKRELLYARLQMHPDVQQG